MQISTGFGNPVIKKTENFYQFSDWDCQTGNPVKITQIPTGFGNTVKMVVRKKCTSVRCLSFCRQHRDLANIPEVECKLVLRMFVFLPLGFFFHLIFFSDLLWLVPFLWLLNCIVSREFS